MKTNLTNRIGILMLMFFFTTGLFFAQDANPKTYIEVGCIKAQNPGSPDLEAFLMNEAMAYNKAAMDKGMLLDFLVFKMMYPNGEDCKCDYRMVSVYNNMAQMDMLAEPGAGMAIAEAAFGDKAMQAWETWMGLVSYKGSEIFEMTMGSSDAPVYAPMTHVNFMSVKPDNAMAYEKMEQDVWMPVVKEAINEGMLMDYTVWKRVMPNGKGYEGDYIQVVDIDSFAQMGGWEIDKFAAIFQKVHPGVDMMEMMDKSAKLSKMLRDETMQLMGRLSATLAGN